MMKSKQQRATSTQSVTRLSWRLKDLAKATGLSVVTLRRAIGSDALRVFRVGRAVLVHDMEARRFLQIAEQPGSNRHE